MSWPEDWVFASQAERTSMVWNLEVPDYALVACTVYGREIINQDWLADPDAEAKVRNAVSLGRKYAVLRYVAAGIELEQRTRKRVLEASDQLARDQAATNAILRLL